MLTELTDCPTEGTPPVFVTIHEGAGGWNSAIWEWEVVDGDGFYQPCQSGFTNTGFGTGKREDAIAEAKGWAEDEGLPIYIPGGL